MRISQADHSLDTAASIFACAISGIEKRNNAYVVMIETPVDDVMTPMRKVKASSAAMVKTISAPPRRKRGWTTCVFHATIAQIDRIRYATLLVASSSPAK